jgi:hypothetical protein
MLAVTDQGENIEAIARYISEQDPPRTAEARSIRDEWQRFYSGLSSYEANYEQQAYDRARNIRLRYNRANATTDAERAAVERQAMGGLSTEQINGDADRRTTDGSYIPPPSPSSGLVLIGVGVAAVAALLLLR